MYNVVYVFLGHYRVLAVVIDRKIIQVIKFSLAIFLFLDSHAIAQESSGLAQVETTATDSFSRGHTIYLVLKLQQRKLYVYQGEKVIASYRVAIGKKGWETPTGSFQVIQMVRNPSWQNPFNGTIIPAGSENPLGERWIGFWSDGNNTIGFHGTPNENLIGQAVSHGCVRMRNLDVKSLFEKVQVGTTVTVEN